MQNIQNLRAYVQTAAEGDSLNVWVYFRDKNFPDPGAERDALEKLSHSLTPRSLERREKRGMQGSIISHRDLPVAREYIQTIREIPGVLHQRMESRWLNAASFTVEPRTLAAIQSLSFVREVRRVGTYSRNFSESEPVERSELPALKKPSQYLLNYGENFDELSAMQVPEVHDMGYSGEGVRVLIIDTGYFIRHEAVDSNRIVAQRDFIHDDDDTANDNLDHPMQHFHGTCVMSVLGGAVSGVLYGPAYESEFLLAKTEIYDQEIRLEEDYFIAALEWGDSLGADIATASVGYLDWYDFADLDGETSALTHAVEQAIAAGMVVVTSAGNENNSAWDHITVPADADSVISVGAVDLQGNVAAFSSRGPTFDGRIKPEVVAPGVGIWCASAAGEQLYTYTNGTSLSTPFVAGITALMLQAHPEWTPVDVRRALLATAENSGVANNATGWGLVNALQAVNYQQPAIAERIFTPNYPNPFSSRTVIDYEIPETIQFDDLVEMRIFDLLGRKIAHFRNSFARGRFIWDLSLPRWNHLPGGIYFYEIRAGDLKISGKMTFIR